MSLRWGLDPICVLWHQINAWKEVYSQLAKVPMINPINTFWINSSSSCNSMHKSNSWVLKWKLQNFSFLLNLTILNQINWRFLEIFESILTILFIWSLATISGALLMVQMQIVKHDFLQNFNFIYRKVHELDSLVFFPPSRCITAAI